MLVLTRDDDARVEHARTGTVIAPKPTRIGGLDGLRAVAVLAVLAYHLWPDRLPAGFLGVDLFMVLSGFLITGLLIDERARAGVIRLGTFWARRFRRLVPALLALLVGVAIWVNVSGAAELKRTVRGQGIASLLYVGNWKLVVDGSSYAALSNAPSPLLHLWSLAIEEQFYVVWPLVVFGVLFLARGRRLPLAIVAAVGAVASAAWMAVLFEPHHDPLRLYYGTDTRAHAFLIGALAVLAARRWNSERARRAAAAASVPAFALLVFAFLRFDSDALLYRGGFAAFAVVAAVVVVAVTQPGPVTRLLDRGPLRLLGRVSYGVYLWHWPVIVLVTERNSPVHGFGLLVLRLALIAGATAASWLLVERPYQRAPRRHTVGLAPIGIAFALCALVVLPTKHVMAYASFDVDHLPAPEVGTPVPTPASQRTDALTAATVAASVALEKSPSPATLTTTPSTTPVAAPKTVLVIGDSGTYDMSPAFIAGFSAAGVRVVSTAFPGEGLTAPDSARDLWTAAIARYHPDYFIVGLGTWDDEFVARNGQEAYQRVVDSTVHLLTENGAHVLWLSILPSDSGLPDLRPQPETQQRIFAALPSRFPGAVDYLDLRPILSDAEGVTPREVDGHLLRKPDGWHLCPDGAERIAHAVLSRVGLDSDTWITGRWRHDRRYDDPPGGCPGV